MRIGIDGDALRRDRLDPLNRDDPAMRVLRVRTPGGLQPALLAR